MSPTPEDVAALARAWHDYYCHKPDAEIHELDQVDYDRAEETVEALGPWLAALLGQHVEAGKRDHLTAFLAELPDDLFSESTQRLVREWADEWRAG